MEKKGDVKIDKNVLKKIEYLKGEIEEMDNESIHHTYDSIIYYLAKKQNKEVVKMIDELVKDIDFWYA